MRWLVQNHQKVRDGDDHEEKDSDLVENYEKFATVLKICLEEANKCADTAKKMRAVPRDDAFYRNG